MSSTVSIRDWTGHGEPTADLDRLFGPLYRGLATGEPTAEMLRKFCELLAQALPAAMVSVCRKLDGGVVGVEAAAPTHGLWVELQSLPERWDQSVTGHGPAAIAIQSGAPAWLSASEEGLRPWRKAMTQEQVAAVGAWPLVQGSHHWLIEVFSATEALFQNGAIRRQMGRVTRELAQFLEVAERNHQQSMLASALARCGHAAFITDLDGRIVWINPSFSRLYGYSADQVRGNTPRMLHSGKQGLRYYRDLWSTIRSGKVWIGETVDRDRDGKDHTVRQTVSPFGAGDRVTHYLSLHEDITVAAAERAQHQLQEGAAADAGLMNSARFAASVEAAIARNEPFTLILLSLRGYDAATTNFDQELVAALNAEFGSRVHDILGPGSTAGVDRPGEYRMLLPTALVTNSTIQRLLEGLQEPFPMLGRRLDLRPRAALARSPLDGKTQDELTRFADAQLADQPVARVKRNIPDA